VRVLNRKLLRDLMRLRWQMAAIALLIGCGVSVAVMATSAQKTLILAQRDYYKQTHFADLFATATRAPMSLLADLGRINGVTVVDARATKAGLMEVPGLLRPATAHLIALPDDERRALNRIVVVAGRLPNPQRTDEAVALATFLDAAHVRLGDRLSMVIAGHHLMFRIVGAALSPEFVYAPSNGPMPDDAHEGVFWAPRAAVEQSAGLRDAFSAVSFALAPGASGAAALDQIDRLLAPYGGSPSIPRADQVSHKFQADRIERLGVMAAVIPPVFLFVAASLVHLVLRRLVEAEREQIGLLKAFGYADREAAAIYVKMGALVAIAGVVAGGLAGAWLARAIVGALGQFMRMPRLDPQFSWTAFGIAAVSSTAAAILGSLRAATRAAQLSPAVAMQPPAPMIYRRTTFEDTRLWSLLDQPTRMIARNLRRYPGRAAWTVAGLGVSLALLVGSQFIYGEIDGVIDQAYFQARRWTDEVAFSDVRSEQAIAELARFPAVAHVEPFRRTSASLRAHGQSERVLLIGIDTGAALARPLATSGEPVPFVGRGMLVSQPVAAHLRLVPGDRVDVEINEGRRTRTVLRVGGIVQDYAGLTVQMSRAELNGLMADGNLASGADLTVAQDERGTFYRALGRAPQIIGAGSRDDVVLAFRDAITAAMTIEMVFYLGFAAAIAFGVAYNISRIALADRSRDLATLRVLGFSPADCAYVLAGELALLALLALPIGVGGGCALGAVLISAFEKQDFYLPYQVTPHGIGIAFLAYAVAVLVAAVLVVQRVWRLDLVTVLKTRD
jgi:putative ABC transport system permease protein